MSIILLKSILSVVMLFSAVVAMFTMFEVFGRSEKKYDVEKIKRLHKANGVIYLSIFIFVSYFCLKFIVTSGAELTPRGTFHTVFALTIIILFGLKIAYLRIYRQFYGSVKTIGILIALITFGMAGLSGGYYLLVSKMGTDKAFDRIMESRMKRQAQTSGAPDVSKTIVRTDPESVAKGKEMYESKCYFCHEAHSTEWGVGPGHKGIMKNPLLPVSKKPATPENIAIQIKKPFGEMPSFSYLSDEDILNLVAYLNTL